MQPIIWFLSVQVQDQQKMPHTTCFTSAHTIWPDQHHAIKGLQLTYFSSRYIQETDAVFRQYFEHIINSIVRLLYSWNILCCFLLTLKAFQWLWSGKYVVEISHHSKRSSLSVRKIYRNNSCNFLFLNTYWMSCLILTLHVSYCSQTPLFLLYKTYVA